MTGIDDSSGIAGSPNYRFAIRQLRVGDGDPISLSGPGSVVAVVGGNNVGKSTLLRQTNQLLNGGEAGLGQGAPRVATEISSPWIGSPEELTAWMLATAHVDTSGPITYVSRPGGGVPMPIENVAGMTSWPHPGGSASWFVNYQTPTSRVNYCNPASRVEPAGSPPTTPMQTLFVDPVRRKKVQDFAQRVFGIKLHFDSVSAGTGFRVGDPGVPVPLADAMNRDYATAVGQLPPLNAQGDGIQSALGLMIPLITDEYPLSLIDEPEAFLHPPQARLVGAEMGKLATSSNSQLIVATHDKNVLVGLVESGVPLTVLHLTRSGDSTTALSISSEDVAALWADPTLRYGDALNGLFHRAVIVTESDRDSQFYAAAIDAAYSDTEPRPPAHNIMFVGSNGKQNIPRFVEKLRKLGVRTVSSPDLDILNSSKPDLRRLVEAHGGQWTDFEQTHKEATNEFGAQPKPASVTAVKEDIDKAFNKNADDELTKPLADAIALAVKMPTTSWAKLKDSGDRAFKANKTAATKLLDDLDALGIVTARVGVLENFVTSVNAPKGPEFLPVAFGANAQADAEATKHAKRLLRAAGIKVDST